MASKRELIEAEIKARLETILTTNTNPVTGVAFKTDIGRQVENGRLQEPDPNYCPGCNFSFVSEDAAPEYGRNARAMHLTIDAFQIDREDAMISIAQDMLEDVESVFLYEGAELLQTLGGLCYEIKFNSKDPYKMENEIPLSGMVAEFTVKFDP